MFRLTRMIAQQLAHIARHPRGTFMPQQWAMCEKHARQWDDVRGSSIVAPDAVLLNKSSLLH